MEPISTLRPELAPSFTAFCHELNTAVAGLGHTIAGLPNPELLLATDRGAIVGVAQLKGDFLAKLLVLPQARRQGFGRALVQTAAQRCQQAGYSALYLDTSPSLRAALALYRSIGFAPAPTLHPLSAPGALHLWLPLPPAVTAPAPAESA